MHLLRAQLPGFPSHSLKGEGHLREQFRFFTSLNCSLELIDLPQRDGGALGGSNPQRVPQVCRLYTKIRQSPQQVLYQNKMSGITLPR